MAEITEYMEQLGVTPVLIKTWQEEDVEADEPAPFLTRRDALTLAERGPALGKRQVQRRPRGGAILGNDANLAETRLEAAEASMISQEAHMVEEVVAGKTSTDRIETVRDTARRADVEVEQTGERARAGRR